GRPAKRRVMTFLSARPASAAEVSRALEVPIEAMRAQIAELEEEELVEPVDGSESAEPVYASTMRTFDDHHWKQLSIEERLSISERISGLMTREIDDARGGGTFEGRPDRPLSRLEGMVDEKGFRRLAALHDEPLQAAIEILNEAGARLEASGEEGI